MLPKQRILCKWVIELHSEAFLLTCIGSRRLGLMLPNYSVYRAIGCWSSILRLSFDLYWFKAARADASKLQRIPCKWLPELPSEAFRLTCFCLGRVGMMLPNYSVYRAKG